MCFKYLKKYIQLSIKLNNTSNTWNPIHSSRILEVTCNPAESKKKTFETAFLCMQGRQYKDIPLASPPKLNAFSKSLNKEIECIEIK